MDTNGFYHCPKPSSASHILLGLQEMQQEDHLCDVILETSKSHQIAAHRVVLATCSPYFKAMFVNKLIESTQRKVLISDVDSDILDAVVAYAYNAKFFLPQDRVLLLMIAADRFQIIPLHQGCSSFLEQQLEPHNCLSLRAFADIHNCSSLFDLCTKYASKHFEQVVCCDEYLSLPCDQLKGLISRDEVRVTCEEQVYSAVLQWVYHKLDERKDSLPEVMSHVRLPFVSPQFLSGSVARESLIRDEEQCQSYIQEAYIYKNSPEKRSQLRYSPRSKPRKPSGVPDVILTAGGMCKNHPLSVVEQYDLQTNSWTVLCQMDTGCFGLASCFSHGRMYAIGGYNDTEGYLNSVQCFNVKQNKWTSVAPMIEARRYFFNYRRTLLQ